MQGPAILLLGGGIAGLYHAWKDRRLPGARRRLLVAGCWLVIAAGIALWCVGTNSGVAISQAVVAAMLLALAAVALQAFSLRRAGRQRNGGAMEPAVRPANLSNRLARLAGSLVVVPSLGVVAGLAWFAWVPGLEADRLMGMAFLAIAVAATGFVVLLASARPTRMLLILCVMILAVTGVLLPVLAR